MRGILKSDPEAKFFFWGGDQMANVGGRDNLGLHYSKSSFFGFVQVALHIFTIMAQMRLCKRQIVDFNPDVVILIDYAGFNLRIAEYAKKCSIKCYFYIAPKVWAWNAKRIEKIRKWVDELFIIFPFEKSYFAERGIESHFEGNPLVDAIESRCSELPSREQFFSLNRLDSSLPIVALLAGSRASEIKANLPLMRTISENFPEYQFIIAGVDWLPAKSYDKWLKGSAIRLLHNQTYELLKYSEAAIVTSGTATLETALIGTPQVVIFRIPEWMVKLRPIVVKIPFISLVNINLDRECVKEILQSSLNPALGTDALKSILNGGERRQKMLNDYQELATLIGGSGASERFAEKMVELLKQ